MIGQGMRTYIYIRLEDGKCVHSNACGGFMGEEYEHDDPNWQPPEDWPYEVKDLRQKEMTRQAAFRDDATITDVPTKLSENPQLEKQLDLFQFGKDTDNLARLEGV